VLDTKPTVQGLVSKTFIVTKEYYSATIPLVGISTKVVDITLIQLISIMAVDNTTIGLIHNPLKLIITA